MSKEITEENKTEDPSRKAAIEKAMGDEDKGEKKEESKEEIKEENEEKEEEPEGPSQEDITNALNLYKALNDPTEGPRLLRMLASEAGIDKDSTKEEVKQVEKTIKELVKEGIGPEYQFFADKLGNTLETVINNIVDKKVNEVKENLAQRDRKELGTTIDNALSTCFNQYEEVPLKVQEKFNSLIDEMPPVPGKTNPLAYFNRLIKIAAEETNIKLVTKENKTSTSDKSLAEDIKNKVMRNKRDASSRLASKGAEAEVDDTSRSVSTPAKSRKEAIEAAIKETDAKFAGKV